METWRAIIGLQPRGDFSLVHLEGDEKGTELFGRIERVLVDEDRKILIVHLEQAWDVHLDGEMIPSDRNRLVFALGLTPFEEVSVDSGRIFISENGHRTVMLFTEHLRFLDKV